MTSVLNVDTIAAKDGTSPVELTKQEAVKHYVNYDAVDQTTDSSFNQSSITDYTTGDFASNFTNNFGSATNKVHFSSVLNSKDGGNTRQSSGQRAGVVSNIGVATNDSDADLLSTDKIQFYSAYGSSGSSNGAADDYSATYCTSIGDLA